jgi:sulfopyruvate decarboxylase TPP-binding subunit
MPCPRPVAGTFDFRLGTDADVDRIGVFLPGGPRMDADLLTEPDDKIELKGSGIIAAIKSSGIEFILSVPDIVTSGGLLRPIARDPELKLIRVCKEDECIGIASGLSYCDKRALTLIQYTGFLDSINAIRGIAVEYGQPICMMIGLLGHDPYTTPRNSPRYGVRIIEPILDAMGIPHHLVNEEADVAKIRPAIEDAYTGSHPVALLIGRRPSAS